MHKTTQLNRILSSSRLTVAPGACDALSARLIEEAGFPAISVTGAGISASQGYPDIGLITMTEVVSRVHAIAEVTRVPILADADAGYGNVINVIRAVREFERAGAAGIHLEDQMTPKKCGQLSRKRLISAEEMEQKIRAAGEARRDPDFVLIARTDARAELGVEETIRRANRYMHAGADAIFIYGPRSQAELRTFAERVNGPLVAHITPGSELAGEEAATFEELGYRLLLFPLQTLLVAVHAQQEYLKALRGDPSGLTFQERMELPGALYELVGLTTYTSYEDRFSAHTEMNA